MKWIAHSSLFIYRALGKEEKYHRWTEFASFGSASVSIDRISSTRLPAWYYYHYFHKHLYALLYRLNGNKNVW